MKPSLTIKGSSDDAYAKPIIDFAIGQFPQIVVKTAAQIVDALTSAFIGTNQTRYGPIPSPESQVAIRDVIRHHISAGTPIPFMLPWGSEKPDGTGIDVAELSALKTLVSLHDRIAMFYPAGAVFNLRVEDLSAPHQFYDRMDQARFEARRYADGLVALAKATAVDDIILVTPDSTHGVTEEEFNKLADNYIQTISEHIKDLSDPRIHAQLKMIGWDKPLAPETIDHYLSGYAKLYPNRDLETKINILARYFAGALARKQLGLSGARPEWGGRYLDLYFGKTPPGLLPERYLRRIHYRTIPSSFTSLHIAPWRAKGYLKISSRSEACPKLASFNDQPLNLNKYALRFCAGGQEVRVQADYVLEEEA